MSDQAQPFMEPKPASFAMLMDTRPIRKWNIKDSFNDILHDRIVDTPVDQSKLTPQDKKNISNMMTVMATIQMASLQQGLDFLPLHLLAGIELIGDRSNFEKVKEETYVDYRQMLAGKSIVDLHAAEQQASYGRVSKKDDTKKEDDDWNAWLEENEDQVSGVGFTYLHNMNLYNGAAELNPFKKQDDQYALFEDSKWFGLYSQQFMSPLRSLGQDYWDLGQAKMQSIQDKAPKLEGLVDPFHDNAKLNIDEFSMASNYHTLLNHSLLWKNWNQKEFFAFILRHWSDVKNYTKSLSLFAGSAHQQQVESDRQAFGESLATDEAASIEFIESIETQLTILENEFNQNQSLSEESQKTATQVMKDIDLVTSFDLSEDADWNTVTRQRLSLLTGPLTTEPSSDFQGKEWFDHLYKTLPRAEMMLPFGLMAETADMVMNEMRLGVWGDEIYSNFRDTELAETFMGRGIRRYFKELKSTLLTRFQPNSKISTDDLVVDNIRRAQSLFDELVHQGHLFSDGTISPGFDPVELEDNFVITGDEKEDFRLFSILRNAAQGAFNLDLKDSKVINDKERHMIKLTTPGGESLTLQELVSMIGNGKTVEEQYQNTRKVYDVFFDMLEQMTGLGLGKSANNGQPQYIKRGEDEYELPIYAKGSWKQWADHHTKSTVDNQEVWNSGWSEVTDQPISITFDNTTDIDAFVSQVRQLLAAMEPIVGTFHNEHIQSKLDKTSYQNGEAVSSPLRLLNDNEGLLVNGQIVEFGSADYQLSVDTPYAAQFFQSQQWQDTSKYVSQRTVEAVGKTMFEKNIINRLSRSAHRKQKEKYSDRKKEHQEREYERIRQEMRKYFKEVRKRYAERKKQDAIAKKKHAQKIKAEQARAEKQKKAKAAARQKKNAAAKKKEKK